MTMTAQQRTLIAKLKAQDLRPRSYSGRGMYGEHCIGASMRRPGDAELPMGYRMDSLGMGVIVYWPNVPWPEGMEE